ncbi:hypothetical protein MNBD_GAMMA20-2296 [hydrothermal vent metagenome]|uniref:Uncharacterized protein n=1 Tax=hydrothermal vent metagenome TaxID=652676 RepID=A0A3B1B617_9ZZZZ
MARPASERASHPWLQQHSGLGGLIGYDDEAMGLERLYQASDMLWRHREALQAHFSLAGPSTRIRTSARKNNDLYLGCFEVIKRVIVRFQVVIVLS